MREENNIEFERLFESYLPQLRRMLSADLVPVEPMNEPVGELMYLDCSHNINDFKFFRGYGV